MCIQSCLWLLNFVYHGTKGVWITTLHQMEGIDGAGTLGTSVIFITGQSYHNSQFFWKVLVTDTVWFTSLFLLPLCCLSHCVTQHKIREYKRYLTIVVSHIALCNGFWHHQNINRAGVCECLFFVFICPIALIQGKLHQNNTLVSTETMDHCSLYSILYIIRTHCTHVQIGLCWCCSATEVTHELINGAGVCFNLTRCHLTSIGIPIIKIRWSNDHLIFMIVIPMPGKIDFILKQGPGVWELNAIN